MIRCKKNFVLKGEDDLCICQISFLQRLLALILSAAPKRRFVRLKLQIAFQRQTTILHFQQKLFKCSTQLNSIQVADVSNFLGTDKPRLKTHSNSTLALIIRPKLGPQPIHEYHSLNNPTILPKRCLKGPNCN